MFLTILIIYGLKKHIPNLNTLFYSFPEFCMENATKKIKLANITCIIVFQRANFYSNFLTFIIFSAPFNIFCSKYLYQRDYEALSFEAFGRFQHSLLLTSNYG